MKNNKEVLVYADWLAPTKLIGTLFCVFGNGKQVYSFEYSKEWLKDFSHITLDPDLYNTLGRQYVSQSKTFFGFLSDCLPDRWGRKLLKRKEAIQANIENRPEQQLTDYDYLIGINDETRMGALRFKHKEENSFISATDDYNVPPFENLRKLEQAALDFERTEFTDDKALQLLLKPGSSLGGARPKATVKDANGVLWIVKFPSQNDEYNTGAWEKVTSDLARMAGLNVPETMKKDFNSKGSTFLTKRFDRIYQNGKIKRIHCASALTMLGKVDGADNKDGSSYLELVDFIKDNSIQPNKDLEELWNRIVFSILVSNTDDHLRNHNFILSEQGWKLAPLFDVNPNPFGKELSLNITENNNLKRLSLAMDTAKYYNLSFEKAKSNAIHIATIVKDNWRQLAKVNGCSNVEIERMKSAFEDESILIKQNKKNEKEIDIDKFLKSY